MLSAKGRFDISLAPLSLSPVAEHTGLGRMSLDKRFYGELEAVSQGEMLSFRSAVAGSAGYVAMETITGTLAGREGSFVLQHSASMNKGEPQQTITVVPDSATQALSGLSGTMTIIIEPGGQHFYDFDYQLP